MLAPLLLAAALSVTLDAATDEKVACVPVDQRLELELNPRAAVWSGSLHAILRVEGAARGLTLRFAGPTVSRVALTDAHGRVESRWAVRDGGTLVVETARPLAPGRAELDVAFDGAWSARGAGVARDSARALAWLDRGAGRAFPAWPGDSLATPWTLLVHAPERLDVHASGRRVARDANPPWRSWTFRAARATRGDSLHVTVRPAARRR